MIEALLLFLAWLFLLAVPLALLIGMGIKRADQEEGTE